MIAAVTDNYSKKNIDCEEDSDSEIEIDVD